MLAPGRELGGTIKIPELAWAAQTIPHFDYLLDDAESAALLAGGHCIPVRLPQASRFFWHKLFSSTKRKGFPEKAAKDRQQAFVLGARLAETESHLLIQAFKSAPAPMIRPIKILATNLIDMAKKTEQPELVTILKKCLR